MANEKASEAAEDQGAVAVVTSPAAGGTLRAYADYLKKLGQPCEISADGKQAWIPGRRGSLHRFPVECTEPVEPAMLRTLLRKRGIWLLYYSLEPGEGHPANCFDYVCRAPDYRIEDLPANARRDIRRGLRSFTVRLCMWDELAEHGFAAHVDTAARHGYAEPDPQWLADMVGRQRGTPFYEVWGAWREDGQLAAWMTVIKIDNWAIIDIARSRSEALKWCPNNAICYAATRRLLVEEGRSYVSYGGSSIQVDVNELSMHKYKIKMGYEPLRLCRVFRTRPLLRPIVTSRLMSWTWEKLAKVRPKSASLRKLAGMSRILSGREKHPLSWAGQ